MNLRNRNILLTVGLLASVVLLLASPASVAGNATPAGPDPARTKSSTSDAATNISSGGSVTSDLFSGTASASIPIEVVPGRNGMQPNISLTYSSSGGNNWLGIGWDYNPGAVVRGSKNGVCFTCDDYELLLGGSSGTLVYIGNDASGNREYRTKVEGAFSRIKKITSTNSWQVTTRDGTIYEFGKTSASRQDEASNPSNIFKWVLDRVIDVDTNYMDYAYFKNGNQIYLSNIYYTGHLATNTQPTNRISFLLSIRSTDWLLSYATNFSMQTLYRLNRIVVYANDIAQRSYDLQYDNSTATGRSRLTRVTQSGKNGGTLPANTFSYSGVSAGNYNDALPGPSYMLAGSTDTDDEVANNIAAVKQGDFNGDGRSDLLINIGPRNGSAPMKVYLSNSSGTFFPSINGPTQSFGSGEAERRNDIAAVKLGDFNADGRTDIIVVTGPRNGGAYMQVYLANTNGSFSGPYNGPWHTFGYGDAERANDINGVMLADFNADGRMDLLAVQGPRNGSAPMKVYLSNGNGSFSGPYNGPNHTFGNSDDERGNDLRRIKLGDFNGDGKTDLAVIQAMRGSQQPIQVFLSNGNGSFSGPTNGPSILFASSTDSQAEITNVLAGIKLGDINGDQRTDILIVNGPRNGSEYVKTYISMGTGSFAGPYNGPLLTFGNSDAERSNDIGRVVLSDVNGDGMADIFLLNIIRSGTAPFKVYLATGYNAPPFNTSPITTNHNFSYSNTDGEISLDLARIRLNDFDGDGMMDVLTIPLVRGSAPSMNIRLASADAPDLMTQINNGIGGITTLVYKPSTYYPNTQLPFPVQVLSRIATNDGNGNNAYTDYYYTNGFYHLGQRDFRGFAYAKITYEEGPFFERMSTETWFHQHATVSASPDTFSDNNYMKGKPWQVEVRDLFGTLLNRTTTEYETDGTSPHFNPPKNVYNYMYDGQANPVKTLTQYVYDAYGNVTYEYQNGDTDTSNDNRTVARTYAYNTTNWIVGLPLTETIYQSNPNLSNKRSETYFYYDGSNTCNAASTNQMPTKGKLTRIQRWNNGGTNVSTQMAYDQYGNLTCTRDANGNQATTSYDATNTFPVSTVSPLATPSNTQLTTTTSYYGAATNEQGIYGQIKSITDVNNSATTTTTYDTFGRIRLITAPDGTTRETFYENFGLGMLSQHIRTNNSAGLQSWAYFDGLGRTILTKSTAPEGHIIRVETKYDKRGQVWETSLPYKEGQSPSSAKTIYRYDTLGRVIRVNNPDGTYSLSCYGPLVRVSIDPKGHRKRITTDIYDRVAVIDEYTGTFSSCDTSVGTPYATTYYEYDTLGNLTKVTDAQNNITTIQYDTLSRKISMSDPNMGTWSYTYDANGNLLTQTDAKGQVITFTYDQLNRVKTKTVPDVTLDMEPPTAPTNLAVPRIETTLIDLTWTASTDDVGVTGYLVERCQNVGCINFSQIRTTTATGIIIDGLTPNTNYSFRVRATDALGRLSNYSNTVSVATQPLSTYTLTVHREGSAASIGLVTSSPAGINCGSTCTVNMPAGSVVTLTATPGPGSVLPPFPFYGGVGFYGSCPSYTATTCTFTMNSAVSVSAHFNDIQTPTMPGTPVFSGGTGTAVTISWSASSDNANGLITYQLERCTGSSCTSGFTQIRAFQDTLSFTNTGLTTGTVYGYRVRARDEGGNMTDFTPIAYYRAGIYSLTVNKNGSGSGTVTSNPVGINCGSDCSENYNGETVVLSATPEDGSTFGGWSGGSCYGTSLSCYITMNQARSVTATFNSTSGSNDSRLINISTRAYVGTGANRAIAGFIISGNSPKQVLIRARGPSMSGPSFNVPGTLSNPMVQLHSFAVGRVIAKNDTWSAPIATATPGNVASYTANSCESSFSCIAPPDPCSAAPAYSTSNCSAEASLLITLPPGAYTAIESGVGDTVGVGLIEVNEVSP